jgi:Carboxypeptidase regulatory-like domain/TonB-dependent Receptor Plug Domain/TonB dependent receptor
MPTHSVRHRAALLTTFVIVFFLASSAWGQSITAGDVTGTITDPTGAVVPDATVTLTNADTNTSRKVSTNAEGSYRFAFVPPGNYQLAVSARGFQTQDRSGVQVSAGQPATANVQLALASASQTVDVVESTSVLQTDNADATTTFSREMVRDLPSPGGDLTYIAQTAPGVVMNTQSGYGNFSALGMPGISNLFTVNGQNYNDPFAGINNSGASNLLLGSNDIAEASVINNAYSAQYGQYAGSQITYITKSGTNQLHGDAIYMWNGRALNANQFFSNQVGASTPFNNFNQWMAGVQGPIWKNRTFFDVDYEGLRNVLPTASALTLVPSPQFQASTLANLAANGNAAEIPFYKQIFAVYNGAAGVQTATPVAGGGCQGFTGLAAGTPCALQFRTTPPNTNKEYQWSARVDHNFSDNDRGYIRVLRDNGFQPTFTSPFGPAFNEQSNQPQMSGQVSEMHAFGPNTVNQFSGSALFYAAIFTPSDPDGALAALPTFIGFAGTPFTAVGAFGQPPFPPGFFFPQGRRVFQYQLIDDFSHIHGKHTLRAGISWLHANITDLDFQALAGAIHGEIATTISDFFNGGGTNTTLTQAFPSSPQQYFVFNTVGGYVADDWKVSDRLTVSLNLRLEHYASPACTNDCFSRLAAPFTGTPDANAASTPYNQLILDGQKNAYSHTQAVVWEPRIGVAWRPFHSESTVIRTGAGIFADELPGGLAESAAFNAPGLNAFTIGNVSNGSLAPGVPGSLFTTAAAANQSLLSQFHSGGSLNSISESVPGFSPPNFYSFPDQFHQPTYYKWNFEVQQALPSKMALIVNYSGMHGVHIPMADAGLNAYCPTDVCPNGFAGLPAAPANAALGVVTQYLSAGTASYNGLTISLQKRLSAGLSFNLNYTWSHSLDDVSNGGVANEQFGILDTNPDITFAQNPFNIRSNYGNSDYDVRHYVSASFLLNDMFRHAGFRYGPNRIFGGWTLSGNWFFRTGLPFTVIDNANLAPLLGLNYNGAVFASPAVSIPNSCTHAVSSPCLSTSQFAPAGQLTGFGTIGRNSIYGPHFFDVDLALMKDVRITERVIFSFGAQAYNVFNHANFDQPVSDISNPLFGSSISAVGPPTSLLGSFVGAGSSPRFVEIKGLVRF